MCRIVAYAGTPVSPERLIFGGDHSLEVQSYRPREMLSGSVNADGVGIVWYVEDRPVRFASQRPIWQEADLPELLASVRSSVVIGAVRNSTPGIPYGPAGTPPLVRRGWAFTLNGWLDGFRKAHLKRMLDALPDHLYAELEGVSDTELLFMHVIASLEKGARPAEAIAEVAQEASRRALEAGQTAQLNLALASASGVIACRVSVGVEPNSLYMCDQTALAPNGVTLASEPLDEGSWRTIEPQSVVQIGRDGTWTTRPS
jgi:glutamine amidotransferase